MARVVDFGLNQTEYTLTKSYLEIFLYEFAPLDMN